MPAISDTVIQFDSEIETLLKRIDIIDDEAMKRIAERRLQTANEARAEAAMKMVDIAETAKNSELAELEDLKQAVALKTKRIKGIQAAVTNFLGSAREGLPAPTNPEAKGNTKIFRSALAEFKVSI